MLTTALMNCMSNWTRQAFETTISTRLDGGGSTLLPDAFGHFERRWRDRVRAAAIRGGQGAACYAAGDPTPDSCARLRDRDVQCPNPREGIHYHRWSWHPISDQPRSLEAQLVPTCALGEPEEFSSSSSARSPAGSRKKVSADDGNPH